VKNPQKEVVAILNSALTRRRTKNPSYSIRAFARDLHVSPSFMSLLLAGKRRLTVDRAKAMASALTLSKVKSHRFVKSVALASIQGEDGTNSLLELLSTSTSLQNFSDLDIDRFQYFNHWYHVAILDLSTCDDFNSDIRWISERLGIRGDVTKTAIDRLLRLGVLKREQGALKKTEAYVNVPNGAPSTVIRNFHAQMIEKAKQALDQSSLEEFKRRAITGITFAVAPENIEAAKDRIAQFKREMMELVENGQCTDVYQMNIQFFPLTQRRKDQP
jgi:uncharacterized protein (TIGR02147 family)